MDTAEDNPDKIQSKDIGFRASTVLAMLIIASQILIALVSYPFMPAMVPTHWDAAGNVNGYMPRWIGVPL
jgi:uncharacterized membrane protein